MDPTDPVLAPAIEQRGSAEVTHVAGQPLVPEGVPVRHPAFDVTLASLVRASVTERGIARAPHGESRRKLAGAE